MVFTILQASYMKEKSRLYWGSSDLYENLTEFCQISLKILPYLKDFSPQLMACMEMTGIILWENKNTKIFKNSATTLNEHINNM